MILRIPSFRSRIFLKTVFFSSHKKAINFQESIPYKFSGFAYADGQSVVSNIKSFINEINGNLENNFSFAYDGLLNAIQTRDLDLLNTVLENKFFKKQKEYTQILEENNLRIELIEKDDQVIVVPLEINLIFVANLQRDLNPKKFYKIKLPNTPMNFLILVPLDVSRLEYLNLKPILQIPVVFKSKKKLILIKKDEVLNENQKNSDFHYHKVIFECEGLDLANIRYMFHIIKIITRNGLKQFIAQMIFHEGSEWKVTDIDDYMNGNDFIEN